MQVASALKGLSKYNMCCFFVLQGVSGKNIRMHSRPGKYGKWNLFQCNICSSLEKCYFIIQQNVFKGLHCIYDIIKLEFVSVGYTKLIQMVK